MRRKRLSFDACAIAVIVVFSVVLRLFFAFSYHEVWWDSGVYVGMGKFLFSSGESGLWEHIRPPLVPLGLGALWWFGFDPVLFGRLVEIALMAGVVFLTYLVGREWFGARCALLASLMVGLSPIFFYLSFHQYTEIPAVFFVLLALFLVQRGWFVVSGLAVGLAFLAKFPAGMFVAILALYLAYNRDWRSALKVSGGFLIAAVPYFVASAVAYGSPLATLRAGQSAIDLALGCNVLRYRPWWQYFYWLVFSESKLYLAALPGLFFLRAAWKKQHLLFVLSLVLPFFYFMQLHCRDYRYLTLFLPFAALLAAYGVVGLFELKIKKRWAFVVLLVVSSVWLGSTALRFYDANEVQVPDAVLERYLRQVDVQGVSGEVWVSHPSLAARTDRRLEKVYYPIYDGALAVDFTRYVEQKADRIGLVLLDNCQGGLICPPNDAGCEANTQKMIALLDVRFARVFDEQSGRCWYRVWAKNVTS